MLRGVLRAATQVKKRTPEKRRSFESNITSSGRIKDRAKTKIEIRKIYRGSPDLLYGERMEETHM